MRISGKLEVILGLPIKSDNMSFWLNSVPYFQRISANITNEEVVKCKR
jgi:hypothetical protein